MKYGIVGKEHALYQDFRVERVLLIAFPFQQLIF